MGSSDSKHYVNGKKCSENTVIKHTEKTIEEWRWQKTT